VTSGGDPGTPEATVSQEAFLDSLREACGEAHVVTAADSLRTYESDGLSQHATRPSAAVLPGTAQEVQRVVRICHEVRVPWVARGAGTGLSGGALPLSEGVLIVLSRLRRVLEVDLLNRCLVVEPGVTNVEVGAAAGAEHLYPPDPSSQIVCSIGGNVAENSGGPRCFKYGFTTNYVIGLEVVLSDGELVRLGGKEVDRPGYDLLGAFVGSEGTLGVATKVWLRLVPAPEAVLTVVGFFPSIAGAGQVVSEIVAAGIVPAALEIMDRLTIEATEETTHAGYPRSAGAALIIDLDGAREECELRGESVLEALKRGGAFDIRSTQDPVERTRIWKGRRAAFAAMGRVSPSYYVQDGVVPRTRLAEILARIADLADEAGLRVANVFHAGDGNLHPLICYDRNRPGEATRAEELAGKILEACVKSGGSITGEHGVGVDKKGYMSMMFDESDLDAFQRLRCAFDPARLANPGKVMPTPRLCGEVPGPYRQHPLERDGVIERI
jgi:glycolate oxidase